MQYHITGGPDGDVKYYWVVEDGKLLESKLGEDPDAEFTLRMTFDDSVKIQQGELGANAAFMQGKMKVDGDMGKLMSLLPLTQAPEYREIMKKVNAITDYGV
jgi:putative sterol carrier protein